MLINLNIMGLGKMAKRMVRECIFIQIKMYIQGAGSMVKNMGMEHMCSMLLTWNMLASGAKVNS